MKIKDFKLILDQYNDDDLLFIELTNSTIYRINKCLIKSTKHDPDLYEIKGAEKDNNTESLVLSIIVF